MRPIQCLPQFLRPGITLSLCLVALAALAEGPPLKGDFPVVAVTKSVRVIHGPGGLPSPENQGFMNNPAFIITSDGVVVIDPGSSLQVGRMVVEKIQQTTDQPVVLSIATHIHGDHWLGNQAIREAWPDARLLAHNNLVEEANRGAGQDWVDLMSQLTGGATDGTEAVIPGERIDDGEALEVGEFSFTFHHRGKAHTNTDIAIMVQPGNVLFSGDLALNSRLGRMDDGHFGGLIETLEHLQAMQPQVVVPGHGQTADGTILLDYAAFYRDLYAVVKSGFEQDLGDFEIKPLAVAALGDYAHWQGFEENIGRLVSLAYLEIEAENF